MKIKKKLFILLGVILFAVITIYILDDRSSSSSGAIEPVGIDSEIEQSSSQVLEGIEIKELDDYILYSDVIVTGRVVETSLWQYDVFETVVEVDQQLKGQSNQRIYLYHNADSFVLDQEWLFFLNKSVSRLYPGAIHSLVNILSRGLIDGEMINHGFSDIITPISLDELIVKINESEFVNQPNPLNPHSLKENQIKTLADNPSLDELIEHSDFVVHVYTGSVSGENPYFVYVEVDVLTLIDLTKNNPHQFAKAQNLALPKATESDTEYLIFYQNIYDSYDLTTRNGSIISEHDQLWEQALSDLEIEAN